MLQKYSSVDDLFGKILGIERVLLINRDEDSLLDVIEKINLIPEHKLLVVEPVAIEINGRNVVKPRVQNVMSITDVFAIFQQ